MPVRLLSVFVHVGDSRNEISVKYSYNLNLSKVSHFLITRDCRLGEGTKMKMVTPDPIIVFKENGAVRVRRTAVCHRQGEDPVEAVQAENKAQLVKECPAGRPIAWLAVAGATACLFVSFGWVDALAYSKSTTRPANSAITRRQISPGYLHSRVREALSVPLVL